MKRGGVYCITHLPSGERYVGATMKSDKEICDENIDASMAAGKAYASEAGNDGQAYSFAYGALTVRYMSHVFDMARRIRELEAELKAERELDRENT